MPEGLEYSTCVPEGSEPTWEQGQVAKRRPSTGWGATRTQAARADRAFQSWQRPWPDEASGGGGVGRDGRGSDKLDSEECPHARRTFEFRN